MNNCFKAVTFEELSPIAWAVGDFCSDFCDFTPYVLLTWQKYYDTKYIITDSGVIFRHTVENKICYAPLTNDITKTAQALFDIENKDSICLSILTEKQLEELKKCFDVEDIQSDEGWADYIYPHTALSEFAGKKYSGQRNHINKFMSSVTSWDYEVINDSNIKDVLDFYKELTLDTSGYNETALYEKDILLNQLEDNIFAKLKMPGGLIRADGKVVSFAFGEVINDMLFVHVEKASRSVQGAYQMIVREFAKHNPASFINREEDMGIEGLRTSKRSYHPERLAWKYKATVHKN